MLANFFDITPCQQLANACHSRHTLQIQQLRANPIKGRIYCLIKLTIHLAGMVVTPIIYTASIVFLLAIALFTSCINKTNAAKSACRAAKAIANALISPLCQLALFIKAVGGVINPGCYISEKTLITDKELEDGSKLPSEKTLITDKELEDGSKLLLTEATALGFVKNSLATLTWGWKNFYDANNPSLTESMRYNFIVICAAFPNLTKDQKIYVIDKMAPFKNGLEGLRGCPIGIASLLQSLVATMHLPKEAHLAIPILAAHWKEELLTKYLSDIHKINYIIANFGQQIGILPARIAVAKQDIYITGTEKIKRGMNDQMLDFQQYCQEYLQTVGEYLINRLNMSDIDQTNIGMPDFRDQILQKLTADITDDALEKSKNKIISAWNLTDWDMLAETYYVRYYYALDPNSIKPNTNINVEAIKAFCPEVFTLSLSHS